MVLQFDGRKHGGGTCMANTIDTMVHAILMGHGISMASAEIMMNNVCGYMKNNLWYRVNGPALSSPDGRAWAWYIDGKPHRYYGPMNTKGNWYVNGKRVKA